MQYPQIQFYRGSLVRLANGQLKQVEDLSSDDFIESARLAATASSNKQLQQTTHANSNRNTLSSTSNNRDRFNFQSISHNHRPAHLCHNDEGSSGILDENNNSVFNSPEPTSASYDDSPRMDIEDEETDVELDVVTNDDQNQGQAQQMGLNLSKVGRQQVDKQLRLPGTTCLTNTNMNNFGDNDDSVGNFYVDTSVVRDFLEVGPIQQQHQLRSNGANLVSSCSPASSTGSLTNHDQQLVFSMPSTSNSASSSSSSSNSLHQASISPPVIIPQITSTTSTSTGRTVLVKFFLETSRSIAFIEVPIEQPFFVLHFGWSSFNPQMTYDAFGLKCRRLKIGDTCISLIKRRNRQTNSHNDSDQCDILFSSIKINE